MIHKELIIINNSSISFFFLFRCVHFNALFNVTVYGFTLNIGKCKKNRITCTCATLNTINKKNCGVKTCYDLLLSTGNVFTLERQLTESRFNFFLMNHLDKLLNVSLDLIS